MCIAHCANEAKERWGSNYWHIPDRGNTSFFGGFPKQLWLLATAVPSNTYLMLHHVSDWTDGWGERLLRHHGTCGLGYLLVFLTFNIFMPFSFLVGFFSMYGCFIHVANAVVDSQEQYRNIFPLMSTGRTNSKGIFQVKLASRKLSGTV
jgi:hypothetical protein